MAWLLYAEGAFGYALGESIQDPLSTQMQAIPLGFAPFQVIRCGVFDFHTGWAVSPYCLFYWELLPAT